MHETMQSVMCWNNSTISPSSSCLEFLYFPNFDRNLFDVVLISSNWFNEINNEIRLNYSQL